MSLTAIGTLAYDSIETVHEKRADVLGGSGVHFAVAAANFAPVQLVGVVGTDFPEEHSQLLRDQGIDTLGVEVVEGKTFRWSGRYEADWNTRHTLDTQLNVFEHFDPKVPEEYRGSRFVFLGNAAPSIQMKALEQCKSAEFVVADTMNLWIDIALDDLKALIQRVDGLVLNDEEARMLSGETNLIRAAQKVREMGPRYVIIKKGEHGAFLVGDDVRYAIPAYPVDEVRDPTGAGDSFAGGFMGYLAAAENTEPRTLRRAMLYGTATASFCVQGFGTEGLIEQPGQHKRPQIESRFNELLDITSV